MSYFQWNANVTRALGKKICKWTWDEQQVVTQSIGCTHLTVNLWQMTDAPTRTRAWPTTGNLQPNVSRWLSLDFHVPHAKSDVQVASRSTREPLPLSADVKWKTLNSHLTRPTMTASFLALTSSDGNKELHPSRMNRASDSRGSKSHWSLSWVPPSTTDSWLQTKRINQR